MRLRVICYVCALVVVLLGSEVHSSGDPYKALGLIRPAPVQPAPEFTVPDPNGASVALADYRGKVVFINFWATWCPPCLREMPAMERLYKRFRDQGFVIVAISFDAEGGPVVRPFVTEHGFTFPVGLDPKMALVERYGVRGLPSSFLIDRDGNLVAQAIGPRDWDGKAAQALIELLLERG
ncbi:MAG: peroxiredoxin family protein [Candidatus Methylomirabilia bacterium]